MAGLSYILETNTVAELFDPDSAVRRRMRHALEDDDAIYLCQPVHYEVVRGLFKVKAARKLTDYRNRLVPMLNWMPLIDADWEQAAHHWADATGKGKQLSDIDLLVAALATRLNAIIVSSEEDFDALQVRRVDWRNPAQANDAG